MNDLISFPGNSDSQLAVKNDSGYDNLGISLDSESSTSDDGPREEANSGPDMDKEVEATQMWSNRESIYEHEAQIVNSVDNNCKWPLEKENLYYKN